MSFGGGSVGQAWYDLTVKDEGVLAGLQGVNRELQSAGVAGARAFDGVEKSLLETGEAADKADREIDDLGNTGTGAAGKLKGAFSGVKDGILQGMGFAGGLGVAAIVGQGMTALTDSVGRSIELYSSKIEAGSKANVIFGDSYGTIEKASKSATETVAMSSGAYLDAAGNLGNLLTNFGITGDAAADMSVDMIQLAADMGSFNNADPTEVVEAMGAALRGETEPIRRFGVSLSEAAVQQKAVQMGLVDSVQAYGKLDFATQQTIKTQATYQLILDQTKNAQGDFARTADGLANSQRQSAARTEEALTNLGEKLYPLAQKILPMLADAGTAVIGTITDIIGAIEDWVDDNKELISQIENLVKNGVNVLRDGLSALFGFISSPLGTPVLILFGTVLAVNVAISASEAAIALTTKLIPALGAEAAAAEGAATKTGMFGKAAGLLGGSGGILIGVAAGLAGVNEGLNKVSEAAGNLSTEIAKVDPETREAAAGQEIFGMRLGDVTDHVTNFLGIVAPWHSAYGDMADASDELNGRLTAEQVAADDASESARLHAASLRELERPTLQVAGWATVMSESWVHRVTNMDKATGNVTHGVVAMSDAVATSIDKMNKSVLTRMGQSDAWESIGRSIPSEIATGINQEGDEVIDAADRLVEHLKNGLSKSEQAAKLAGEKYTKAVAAGVRSGDEETRRAAQEVAVHAIDVIEDAAGGKFTAKGLKAIGSYYDSLLASGLDAKAAAVALSAGGVSDDVITKLTGLYPKYTATGKTWDAKIAEGVRQNSGTIDAAALAAIKPLQSPGPVSTWGRNIADAWSSSLAGSIRGSKDNLNRAVRWATGSLQGQSPPKEGPLRFIDKWGENIGAAWAEGVAKGIGDGDILGLMTPSTLNAVSEKRITLRHEIDLRNAPPGITSAGVAGLLQAGLDATGFHFGLRHAGSLTYKASI